MFSSAFRRCAPALAIACLCTGNPCWAGIYGQLRGVVHDPNHRPLPGAHVLALDDASKYTLAVTTDASGAFSMPAVPFGTYRVEVSAAGFVTETQHIELHAAATSILHFELALTGLHETVTVAAAQPDTVTPETTITHADISATPGADRSTSMQMITEFVPGAYITHDMLHMRGGHQVSFLMDGVQIPNTSIASNLAPAISPGDISAVEVQRGSYDASTGDRTYGVFDVAPRTGFEMDRRAELRLTGGTQGQTDNQFSLGDHTQRFAWYASVNGNRSDYGLAPPIAKTYHDAEDGFGGFGTLLYNRSPQDQFRLVSQARRDFFQVPYDPDPNSFENQQYDSSGLRDSQVERDAFTALTWAHSFNSSTVLQVSPFYHSNVANYAPGVNDQPVATTSDRSSQYGGAQIQAGGTFANHSVQAGLYGFGQHDSYRYGTALPCPPENSGTCSRAAAAGGVLEEYVSDSWRARPWFTLQAGIRQSHFSSAIAENVTAPRVGVAVQIPRLDWVFRGFYGRFYQPPPLFTLSAALLQQTSGVLPLHGERDEEHQFGVQIPYRGWVLDADTFRTRVNNFLDHSNIGESSIFIPITVDGALVRAWELTLRSPRLWHTAQMHLAYSNQIAEQRGAVTGGLLCAPGDDGCSGSFAYTPVDHDQRNTLSLGGDALLPRGFAASVNVTYGSGFVNGDPDPATPYAGEYLPAHSSVDAAVRKTLRDNLTASVTATNLGGRRTLLDNSLTFGGFHYNDPREVYGELRWSFHF